MTIHKLKTLRRLRGEKPPTLKVLLRLIMQIYVDKIVADAVDDREHELRQVRHAFGTALCFNSGGRI